MAIRAPDGAKKNLYLSNKRQKIIADLNHENENEACRTLPKHGIVSEPLRHLSAWLQVQCPSNLTPQASSK